jgi:sialidase-1
MIQSRHVTVVRDDNLYEAFADLCLLPTGKLLCIYRESDFHDAGTSQTMLVESDDRGRTWTNQRPFDVRRSFADVRATWNAPRISLLRDGRLVANFDSIVYPDEADSRLFTRNRTCFQTFLWFSEDEGRTWGERQLTEAEGSCAAKVLALTDDHWVIAITRRSIVFPGAFRVHAVHSFDGGRTWPLTALVAEQQGVQHDEPSLVPLPDGRLLCVMRENVHGHRPSHYSYSEDEGRTWLAPSRCPFYADRPSAGLLQSGRLLVVYRNVEPAEGEERVRVGRNPGTWAWLGDLEGLEGSEGESRVLELEHDGCKSPGDYGYSGWVQFDDGEIFCVYHHRDSAPNSYIRGCWFREDDFGQSGRP